jgi:hypothetical protein
MLKPVTKLAKQYDHKSTKFRQPKKVSCKSARREALHHGNMPSENILFIYLFIECPLKIIKQSFHRFNNHI